ncbi:MAG: hypothetical protein K2H89_07595, partial [Oscillospiraceae bacterium]|nr:hypothetical protein [Oscillospiraceae bacterium]
MAFVYDILTDEEKNSFINKYKLSHPYRKGKKADLYSKVYDQDKSATLLPIIRMLLKTAVFIFIFKDSLCVINARYIDKKIESCITRSWTLEQVCMPKLLEDQKEYVLLLIKEAFKM